jgi:hypothetical protein
MSALLFVVGSVAGSAASAGEWGLGLRATGEHVARTSDEKGGIDMGGGALLVRWRMSGFFGLELSLGGTSGKQAGGAFERKTGAADLTAMFHLSPGSRWDFYLLAGIGAVTDKVNFIDASGVSAEQEFKETQGRLGLGLEYRFPHLGLGLEAAAVGRVRNDADHALDADAVPKESGGAQVNLVVGYYF